MLNDLIFPGVFDPSGRLHLDSRPSFDQTGKDLAGKRVVVSVREDRATRSTKQLRWEFGICLPIIAKHCGYERNECPELHYELLAKHYGRRYNKRLRKYVPKIKRSRQLNTKEYAEHQEWLVRFAALELNGLFIPLPNEPDNSSPDPDGGVL
jgi:hypothetical protein